MNAKFLKTLDALYGSASFPTASLKGVDATEEEVKKWEAQSQKASVAANGSIPNWVHNAWVSFITYNSVIFSVAFNSDRSAIAVEYTSDTSDDVSVVIVKKSNGKVVEVSRYTKEAGFSYDYIAALMLALLYANGKEDWVEDWLEKINDPNRRPGQTDLSEEYYKLAEESFDEIFELDENVMFFNGSLREVAPEYLKNALELSELVAATTYQSTIANEAYPENFSLINAKTEEFLASEAATKLAEGFDFSISGTRKFTEEEETLMMNNAFAVSEYVPTKLTIDLASAIYATRMGGFGKPLRTALLYGPAGAGKSLGVRKVADMLHLPIRVISCSANTDENDLLGKPISLGINDGGNGEIRYTDTELTKAIRDGHILLMDEVGSIKEAGVMQILNCLLDDTQCVQLPNGQILTPHPDFMLIMTTNVSYEGVNPINQSLISRCEFAAEVELPSSEEIAERIKKQLSWPDELSTEPISQVITVYQKILAYLKQEGLEDGACDFRAVLAWLKMYLSFNKVGIKKSLKDLAEYTIIAKSTLDSEYHDDIRNIVELILK